MGTYSFSSGPPMREPVWIRVAALKQLSASPLSHCSRHSLRFFGSQRWVAPPPFFTQRPELGTKPSGQVFSSGGGPLWASTAASMASRSRRTTAAQPSGGEVEPSFTAWQAERVPAEARRFLLLLLSA